MSVREDRDFVSGTLIALVMLKRMLHLLLSRVRIMTFVISVEESERCRK